MRALVLYVLSCAALSLTIVTVRLVALCRSKAEVRALADEAGMAASDADFEAAWALASEADGTADGRACLDTFFRARQHLLAQSLVIADLGSLGL